MGNRRPKAIDPEIMKKLEPLIEKGLKVISEDFEYAMEICKAASAIEGKREAGLKRSRLNALAGGRVTTPVGWLIDDVIELLERYQ